MDYNIFSELRKNLEDFTQDIKVVDVENENNRTLRREKGGFMFNTKDMLDTIDLAWQSTYKSGQYDENGQRKTYLNIVRFPAEVAIMQIDLDVSNFLFIPKNEASVNPTWLMSKQFAVWAQQNRYGQVINELEVDYVKYGSCVAKKVGDTIERTPLKKLKMKQDAKNLLEAAKDGYVIETHRLNRLDVEEAEWDNKDQLEFDKDGKVDVFEQYSLVPVSAIKEHNGEEFSEEDKNQYVLAMAVLAPEAKSLKGKKGHEQGVVLFLEEIDDLDFPYEEAHYNKIDGRWLGEGEVEIQIENQIAQNLNANLRRKALLWGAKKIFQTNGTTIAKNLSVEVKDGAVLEVGPNGQISQVATESRHLQEFAQDSNAWSENTRQKSFTFEVATGEATPSGTPFRLGVLLTNSVNSHFGLKKENFAFMLEDIFWDQLIPVFKKQSGDHIINLVPGEKGTEFIKNAIESKAIWSRFAEKVLSKEIIEDPLSFEWDIEAEKEKIKADMDKMDRYFIPVPAGFYDDAEFYMNLEITGEGENVQKNLETLITVWQTMSQQQDPRADKILNMIMGYTGQNIEGLLGKVSNNAGNTQGLLGNQGLGQLVQNERNTQASVA